jgi:hypothetical protein
MKIKIYIVCKILNNIITVDKHNSINNPKIKYTILFNNLNKLFLLLNIL